jgi:PIN domain nuclease of toxin-antitoxin system
VTRLLFDTHLLLWAAEDSPFLPEEVRRLLDDSRHEVHFSAASIWEVAIKRRQGRDDFAVEPRELHWGLIDAGYREMPIDSHHAARVRDLPDRHKDPFDRILVAQSLVEGVTLVTSDAMVAGYAAGIRFFPKSF